MLRVRLLCSIKNTPEQVALRCLLTYFLLESLGFWMRLSVMAAGGKKTSYMITQKPTLDYNQHIFSCVNGIVFALCVSSSSRRNDK